jgi:hypothetical protein
MRWHLVRHATLEVVRSADAGDRTGAVAALRPVPGTFVVSDASWRCGGFRAIQPEVVAQSQGTGHVQTPETRAKLSAAMKAIRAEKKREQRAADRVRQQRVRKIRADAGQPSPSRRAIALARGVFHVEHLRRSDVRTRAGQTLARTAALARIKNRTQEAP